MHVILIKIDCDLFILLFFLPFFFKYQFLLRQTRQHHQQRTSTANPKRCFHHRKKLENQRTTNKQGNYLFVTFLVWIHSIPVLPTLSKAHQRLTAPKTIRSCGALIFVISWFDGNIHSTRSLLCNDQKTKKMGKMWWWKGERKAFIVAAIKLFQEGTSLIIMSCKFYKFQV